MANRSARPKRAAEDYARTHHEDYNGQPSKKPRFDVRNPSALAPDALEEDVVLDADVIGNRGQQVRRGAVNIDGYDSDSENENFQTRADAKTKKGKQSTAKSQAEDDNDMFADLEEDFKDGDNSEGDNEGKADSKKAVRFLDVDEIEGQVKSSKSGGHVSADFSLNGQSRGKGKQIDDEVESSSDSEVDDAVRADTGEMDDELGAGSKKHHAPKLDAFNMRNEQEEGRFDDQGNYVRKAADPDAIHDIWMEGVSKRDMKKAREAADKREEERRKKNLEDDAKSTGDILKTLIPLLERGETVLEALARLGRGMQKRPKWQTKSLKHNTEIVEDDSLSSTKKNSIEAITAAADLLLTRGQPEIYDTERELLQRQYAQETAEPWHDLIENSGATDNKSWEYRWTDARDGGEINGPYENTMMRQWNQAGYFGDGVEFREVGESAWTRIVDFG